MSPGGSEPSNPILEPIIAILIVVALIGLAWYLARRWQGSRLRAAGDRGVPEQRSIHLDARAALPSVRLPRRLRALLAPQDALEAYPRLLDEWAETPELARDPVETPAGHAARLRSTGVGAPALDPLAADYELARFGGITLTPLEQRRAVRRWRRLRRHRPGG